MRGRARPAKPNMVSAPIPKTASLRNDADGAAHRAAQFAGAMARVRTRIYARRSEIASAGHGASANMPRGGRARSLPRVRNSVYCGLPSVAVLPDASYASCAGAYSQLCASTSLSLSSITVRESNRRPPTSRARPSPPYESSGEISTRSGGGRLHLARISHTVTGIDSANYDASGCDGLRVS